MGYIALRNVYNDLSVDPAFSHLRTGETFAVEGEGAEASGGVLFVGEAPGFNENKEGRPFVGKAGQVFEELLREFNFSREDVFITNVLKYRPPGNRDPLPSEINASLPYLTAEINIVDPRIIVPMGRVATRVFISDQAFRDVRGKVIERRGRLVIPLFHPAYALYGETPEEKARKRDILFREFSAIRREYDRAHKESHSV